MSRVDLLPSKGHFYKANLHCHSTLSDGRYTPEQLKALYLQHGYQIIAFSDHNRLVPHPELKEEGFLPLNAVEIDISREGDPKGGRRTYHLNFYAREETRSEFVPFCREYKVQFINELIARANEAGFLVQYNHPRWSLQDARDYLPLEGLWGFEVFNTGCEVEMLNGWGDEEFVQMLRAGRRLAPVATDDNHNRFGEEDPCCDSFGGFTMIKAPELTYDAIWSALEKKDCYASNGPLIRQLYIENGMVYLETSPAAVLMMRTETRHTEIRRAFGETLTQAAFPLDRNPEYIRFEVADARGRKAMTRAYERAEWQ